MYRNVQSLYGNAPSIANCAERSTVKRRQRGRSTSVPLLQVLADVNQAAGSRSDVGCLLAYQAKTRPSVGHMRVCGSCKRRMHACIGSDMNIIVPGPLGELDDHELYGLLGDAWYVRFKPNGGEQYFLAAPADIGKREYDSLRPLLHEDLRRPLRDGVVACVATTIRRSGVWLMPATVVAVLAVRHGLDRSHVEHASRHRCSGLVHPGAPPNTLRSR
jgi:hypothetical protein